jgi:hypothetical protein
MSTWKLALICLNTQLSQNEIDSDNPSVLDSYLEMGRFFHRGSNDDLTQNDFREKSVETESARSCYQQPLLPDDSTKEGRSCAFSWRAKKSGSNRVVK